MGRHKINIHYDANYDDDDKLISTFVTMTRIHGCTRTNLRLESPWPWGHRWGSGRQWTETRASTPRWPTACWTRWPAGSQWTPAAASSPWRNSWTLRLTAPSPSSWSPLMAVLSISVPRQPYRFIHLLVCSDIRLCVCVCVCVCVWFRSCCQAFCSLHFVVVVVVVVTIVLVVFRLWSLNVAV